MIAVSTAAQWLALGGLFVARAFGPLALLVVVCRLAGEGRLDGTILALPDAPAPWFLGDELFGAALGLAALEWLASHFRAPRRALAALDVYYKPLVAALAYVGAGFPGGGDLLRAVHAEVVFDVLRFEPNVPACLVALFTFTLALVRRGALRRLSEQDPRDELGAQGAIAWAEDLWMLVCVAAFVLYPPAALGAALFAATVLVSVRRALAVREEADKVICVCGQPNYRSAVRCAGCGGRNDAPARLGFFGQATADVERDPLHQALALFEVKRCPRCASHLVGVGPRQFCGACGGSAANDPDFFDSYDLRVRTRTTSALLTSALLGAFPLVGTIAAVYHARRRLIAPYTRYVAYPRSWLLRGVLLIAWPLFVALALVPGVGALAMPVMAFTAHRVHRAAFRRAARADDEYDGFGAFSASL